MDFNPYAKGFDTDLRVKRAKRIAEKIQAYIMDGRNKSAMEYGCGTGLVGLQLAENFKSILFMDSSPGMIAELKRKAANMQNGSVLLGDLMKTLPVDLHIDYIFSSMVLHHIKDTKTVLTRFFDLLNTDGRLLIVDLDKDDGRFQATEAGFDGHDGFDQTEIVELLVKAGFRKVEIQTFYHGEREIEGALVHYSLFIVKADKPIQKSI